MFNIITQMHSCIQYYALVATITDAAALLAAAQRCEDGQMATAQAKAAAAAAQNQPWDQQQQVQLTACGGEGLVGEVPDSLICQISKIVDLNSDDKVVEAAWLPSKWGGGVERGWRGGQIVGP